MEKGVEPDSNRKTIEIQTPFQRTPGRKQNRKEQKRKRAEKRQMRHDMLKPILYDLARMENEIAELESRQKDLGQTLADPKIFKDSEKSVPLISEYNDVKEKLESLIVAWEQRHAHLEDTKKKFGA
jgi:hypothetical protein